MPRTINQIMAATWTQPPRTNERTIQLWPGGQSVTFHGDPDVDTEDHITRYGDAPADACTIRTGDTWRYATAAERRAIRIELRAEHYQQSLIHRNQSHLIDELMQVESLQEDFGPDSIENLYPNPDRMTPAEQREYISDHDHNLPDLPDVECTDCNGTGERGEEDGRTLDCTECDGGSRPATQDEADEDPDYTEALADAVRQCGEAAEVYEWYAVDSWLLDRLRDIGEVVIDNSFGEWWGRCTTGQALIMDGVLQRVAAQYEDHVEQLRADVRRAEQAR